jgi:PBSX family phage terminase large subunit
VTTTTPRGYRAVPVSYDIRGGAARMWECRDRQVLLAGPAGTGKSVACMIKLINTALSYPNARIAVVRKWSSRLASTTMTTLSAVIEPWVSAGVIEWHGGSTIRPKGYRVLRGKGAGSTIVVLGLDDPEKVKSSEFDLIYVNEATDLDLTDWQMLASRLRHRATPYRQLLGDCNPGSPGHPLKREADAGRIRLITSLHTDNPAYYNADGSLTEAGEDYVTGVLDQLTGVTKQRLRYGRWVAAEGVIYDFDEAVHVVDTVPEDFGDWQRFAGVDFGNPNPSCVLFGAVSPRTGQILVYRELYVSRTPADILGRAAKGMLDDGETIWQAFVDHATDSRRQFELHSDLACTPADKAIILGIEEVQRKLRIDPHTGEPGLIFLRGMGTYQDAALADAGRPVGLFDEIADFRWATDPSGFNLKDIPQAHNDHAMDSLRYLVVGITQRYGLGLDSGTGGRNPLRFIEIGHQLGRRS